MREGGVERGRNTKGKRRYTDGVLERGWKGGDATNELKGRQKTKEL